VQRKTDFQPVSRPHPPPSDDDVFQSLCVWSNFRAAASVTAQKTSTDGDDNQRDSEHFCPHVPTQERLNLTEAKIDV